MNEPVHPVKKPSGCWWQSGCLLTVISALLVMICISMIFYTDEKMDENRAEYAASETEYEEAMKAYEADSAHLRAEYQRVQKEIEAATARNDSAQVALLQDSLAYYDEPVFHQRGHIGDNIGGALFLFFALFFMIPLGVGLLLLIIYFYKRRKWIGWPMHRSQAQQH